MKPDQDGHGYGALGYGVLGYGMLGYGVPASCCCGSESRYFHAISGPPWRMIPKNRNRFSVKIMLKPTIQSGPDLAAKISLARQDVPTMKDGAVPP
jgi:hypothetical protein